MGERRKMKLARRIALGFLLVTFIAALGAQVWAPAAYDAQFREHPNEAPGKTFLLGTDDLGRDRFARLLYGAQVSLLLAPAAAGLSVAIAALMGIPAGLAGGYLERGAGAIMDLFLCLPWLFVLLAVRALLPLNVEAWASVAITFLLLGLLGWAPGARVLRSGARDLAQSDCALQARAMGCTPWRLALVHLLPQLRPLILAQFWLAIPAYLLTEANLGILGLGVSEPMPSLGNLLAELSNFHALASSPWIVAPAVLLTSVLTCLHLVLTKEVSS
jgi:peptide/nickel transport system permease protein